MKPFKHMNARTLAEASEALGDAQSRIIAGGTDLLGTLKDNILPVHPLRVVNIKTIEGLDYIEEENGALKIGALTRLSDIAANKMIQEKWSALAQSAKAVASPHIREMGTIGGNLSQLPRCWYFRKAENMFNCSRKGGDECFAILGDNRYHSAFGGKKCHASPCTSKCPAGTDIPAYMERLRVGDIDGAARIIMRVNPMPALTSRVCAHNCQVGCNRGKTDENITVSGVERTLGDYMLDNADKFYTAPTTETGKTVCIVGGGPAGLSAAYRLRKAGNRVTVYERKQEAGGMLMYAIPAYRLPKDTVRRFIKALESMGIEFKTGVEIGETIRPEDLEKQYDSVCYATGTWKRPVVGLDGEELTVFGLDFLVDVRNWMEGKVGTDVVVTGGGNVAMDVAITAKRLGANKVTLACLESRDKMPASREEIARAEEEGIVIMPSWGLSRVVEEDGKVRGMEIKRCISTIDETGAFNPQYDEAEMLIIKADNVLMAVGQRVDLSFLDDKYQMQLNRRGLIDVAQDSGATSRDGVFASGDATTGPATVIGAIANGSIAARGINKYLGVSPEPEYHVESGEFVTSDIYGIREKKQLHLLELDAEKRRFDLEDSQTPTWEEAVAEAKRCLNCACYAVHPSDIAPALLALNAEIITDRRSVPANEFFTVATLTNTVLELGEIVTEIYVPALPAGSKSLFKKFALRKAIDFPVVNCAIVTGGNPRVCLGAVAPIPMHATKAEDILRGRVIDETVATAAGEAAVEDAHPFDATKYKVQIAKTLIKRSLLEMR